MNCYDPNATVPEAYLHLDQYINNFTKISSVVSDLLWGDQKRIPSPWLSVIIPTYNRTELLEKAIESVLCQQSVDFSWELIVVDNTPLDEGGMTPALKIIDNFQDPRVLYFHNRVNIGSGYNWNRGVEKARGTWVSFLHDDDILYPDALYNIERIIMQRKSSSKPLGYIQARCDEFSGETHGSRQAANQRNYLLELTRLGTLITYYTRTGMPTCGTTILRQAFREMGGINYDFGPTADAVLGYQIMREYTVLLSDCTLGGYRWGANETLKIETSQKLVYADALLAQYCHRQSSFSKLWGRLFWKAQYDIDMKIKIRNLKQYGIPAKLADFTEVDCYRKPARILTLSYRICARTYREICRAKARVRGIIANYEKTNLGIKKNDAAGKD